MSICLYLSDQWQTYDAIGQPVLSQMADPRIGVALSLKKWLDVGALTHHEGLHFLPLGSEIPAYRYLQGDTSQPSQPVGVFDTIAVDRSLSVARRSISAPEMVSGALYGWRV
jgi:hypothetical protein